MLRMLASGFKRQAFFSSQSSSILEKNSILLAYLSPLNKYTFLNISPINTGNAIQQTSQKLQFQPLDHFVSKIQERIYILKALKEEDYTHRDLLRLQGEQKPQSQVVNQFAKQIMSTALTFQQFLRQIKQNINTKNFPLWMQACLKIQVIDIKIWSLLLKNARLYIGSFDESVQNRIISMTHTYLNTKFMKFTFVPSKFIYRQSCLGDIGNISDLLLVYLQTIARHTHSNEDSIKSFASTLELLKKLSKNTVVNFNALFTDYINREQDYLRLIEKSQLQTILTFLEFYSIVGISDTNKLAKLQERILTQLDTSQATIRDVKNLFKSWGALAHHNEQIFRKIRPIILQNLNDPFLKNNTTTLLFNIISSNIQDQALFQKMISSIEKNFQIDNKIFHIVKHYLNMNENMNENINALSSFPHCYPNSVSHQIVKKHGKAYSSCFHRSSFTKSLPPPQVKNHLVTHQKQVGAEHNPHQQFWSHILQKTFDQLTRQYPHSKNALYFNFLFCVFQLDALIVLDNKYIAFEIIGTHYIHKNTQFGEQETQQGKKMIRSKILDKYGIKMCEIKSYGLIERTISAYKDKKKGEKYVREKILQILREAD